MLSKNNPDAINLTTTPIIFLDIDGVLNSVRTIAAFGAAGHSGADKLYLDPIAVKLMQNLHAQGAHFVLSSSWRMGINTAERLKALSDKLEIPLHSRTVCLMNQTRGDEIAQWFTERQLDHQQCTYAILDDDADMLPEQMEHLIQTDDKDGVTFTDYMRLCDKLKLEPFFRVPG